MQRSDALREEVREYYAVAPRIVATIEKNGKAEETWREIGHTYLVPAVDALRRGDQDSAYHLYKTMFHFLKTEKKDILA